MESNSKNVVWGKKIGAEWIHNEGEACYPSRTWGHQHVKQDAISACCDYKTNQLNILHIQIIFGSLEATIQVQTLQQITSSSYSNFQCISTRTQVPICLNYVALTHTIIHQNIQVRSNVQNGFVDKVCNTVKLEVLSTKYKEMMVIVWV